ncbi:MAG: hypothetical protein V1773_08230 [bacterium]
MKEKIVNIYLVINNNFIKEFRASQYLLNGTDEEKVNYLMEKAAADFETAVVFEAPVDKKGNYMKYKSFSKLAKRGMEHQLFEDIFEDFGLPEKPLICVTPVVDGKIISK